MKILLVEDEEMLNGITAKYLRAKYYYSKSWEEVYTIPDLLPR